MDRIEDQRGSTDAFAPLVLGAGVSGLVAASILVAQGYRNVIVIDEYAEVGGNHIARNIGDYTFDVGSLIFQDDSPLLAHFPELLPHYVAIAPTWGRLNPQGVVTAYPISIRDDLIAAGPFEWLKIFWSVAAARIIHRDLRNARDFARFWIGGYLLHRSGLDSYMKRFYGLPAEHIDIEFARKRMNWIKEHAMIRSHLRRVVPSKQAAVTNTQVVRPREGFAKLYADAVKRLEREGVRFMLGKKLRGIEKSGDAIVVKTDDEVFESRQAVSTIPLDMISNLCGISAKAPLQTVTLISLFFSFEGDRGFKDAILYNFSHNGTWKRLTVYSDFYGRVGGREFFTAEVNANHVGGSVEAAARDFRDHTSQNKLFSGDLRLEGSHILDNAYPVYTEGADRTASDLISRLREFGILSFGRQGGFEYQPTARVSTIVAESALRSKAG